MADQPRALRMKCREPAVDVIRTFPAGRQLKLAAKDRLLAKKREQVRPERLIHHARRVFRFLRGSEMKSCGTKVVARQRADARWRRGGSVPLAGPAPFTGTVARYPRLRA